MPRITRTDAQISIRDRPTPSWALGGFLLVGGLVAVAMPLGLATNAGDLEPWERLASLGIGVGVSVGALWWLARTPTTHVQLDLTRRHVQLVRIGLSGRHVRRIPFDDLEVAEVDQGSDSEGGWRWRRVWRWWQRPAAFRRRGSGAGSRLTHEHLTELSCLPHLNRACSAAS